jgi:hypothetical protein
MATAARAQRFAERPVDERAPGPTRGHWGKIRRLAVEAGAHLDEFLVRSVVVTPEKLDIQFRKTRVAGSAVVEINPGFNGAPDRWLEFFDKTPSVPDHFNIPTKAGAVHVALSEPVRSVLREVKRLPGRRAAGARAEALILNPLAALGEHAAEAIDPDQFAEARKSAGIEFDRFRPFVVRDSLGYPAQVGLKIDTPRGDAFEQLFATDDELGTFISNLEQRLRDGLQLLAWQEFEFELDGEATAHLETLQSVLEEHSKPPIVVRHENVFDLASYSERVVGIGKAQPFISAYIVKKSDSEGWFSSNLLALLKFRPNSAAADVTLPLTPETLPEVREAIADAKGARATSLQLPGSAVPGVRLMRLTLPVPSADAPCLRSANSVSRVGGRISSQPVTLSRLRFCWAMAWLEQT